MPSKGLTFAHGKRLSDYQLEVLEALESIYDATGKKEIRGTDVLKQLGIENAGIYSCQPELRACAGAIASMMGTRVLSYHLKDTLVMNRPLFYGEVKCQYFICDDGVERFDFVVKLAHQDESNIPIAFPFYKRAREIKIEPTEVDNG